MSQRSSINVAFACGLLLGLTHLAGCDRRAAAPLVAPAAAPESKADDNAKSRLASISPASAETVGIALDKAAPAEIAESLSLYGVVKPNAEQVREVVARFPGTVKTVTKAIGDAVRKGETLATIESNESLQTYSLTAPIGGVVTAREADPGEQAASEVLFTIADASSVWVELSLFPADAARVHKGQAVQVDSVSGGISGTGRIGLVGVFGGGPGATLTARVELPNADRRWTAGLFVTGAVAVSSQRVDVAVAASAIQMLDAQPVVFVPVAGGYAPREVKTGRSDRLHVEIVEGLDAGEAYVSKNSFVVKAELGKASLREDDDSASDAAPGAAPAAKAANDARPAPQDDDDQGPVSKPGKQSPSSPRK